MRGTLSLSTLDNLSITRKIPLLAIFAATSMGVVIGCIAFLSASSQEHKMMFEGHVSLLEAKKQELEVLLHAIEQDLRLVAANPETVLALNEFDSAWKQIGGSQKQILQRAYIENNPHPAGKKDLLARANSGYAYDEIHSRHHPWFRKLQIERSYYDVFIFNAKGDLLYSVFKKPDYATNLINGAYKDSGLGQAYRAAMNSGTPDMVHFFDFAPYAPSHGAPASFMSTPIYDNGRKAGVLVYKMPVDLINSVMASKAVLGTTGELIIVGTDNLMRTDSRFSADNDILNTAIENTPIRDALSGKVGHGVEKGYRDLKMNYVAIPFSYQGTTWALAAAQAKDELEAPVVALRNTLLLTAGVLLLLFSLLSYFASRTITMPITKLVETMGLLASGDNSVNIPGLKRKDEIGAMAAAVEIFKTNAIKQKSLEEERDRETRLKEERQAKTEALISKFRSIVTELLSSVASNAEQLKMSAESLNTAAEDTSDSASSAEGASNQATSNVQAVAAASEEMNASIGEIESQVSRTKDLVEAVTGDAAATDEKVVGLAEAAERIGAVISLIRDVAEQTNLLALNATIEAARAGEAGKGFAVVAAEVKELASQTAKATEEISAQIESIQAETNSAVTAIQSIKTKVSDVNEYTTAIAASIEEQSVATADISRNVQEAATRTQEVFESIGVVSNSAGQTRQSAGQVLLSSENVSNDAEKIRTAVEDFLENVNHG